MAKKLNFVKSKLGKLLLEALRWAVLAFVSLVVMKLLELLPGAELSPEVTLLLTAALRLVDKLLHESGVAEKGLTRF